MVTIVGMGLTRIINQVNKIPNLGALVGGVIAAIAAIAVVLGLALAPNDGKEPAPAPVETTTTTPAPVPIQELPTYEAGPAANEVTVTWQIDRCSNPLHRVMKDDASGVTIWVGYSELSLNPREACVTVMRNHTETIELSQPLGNREVNIVKKFTDM